MKDTVCVQQHLHVLTELIGEPLRMRHHATGYWRVDPVGEPSSSRNIAFWQTRGHGGWFPSPEQALTYLAYLFGSYIEPPADDAAIDRAILDLVAQQPGQLTARQLRGMANRQTGRIPCAAARCDASVRRLIEQGVLVRTQGDGRCAGRLTLASRADLSGAALPVDMSQEA